MWDVAEENEPAEDAPEQQKKAHNRKIVVLIWYLDAWLPNVVLPLWWGPTIRVHKLMVDTTDVLGELKVLMTVTSEGFGLLQFENSRNKWIEIFKWKKINGKRKAAPQYSKARANETKQFRAKWSEHKNGQCSGWDPVAYTTFDQRKDHIQAFRTKDAQDDYKRMKFGRDLLKKHHEVGESEEPANKRRKTNDDQGADTPTPVIKIIDE